MSPRAGLIDAILTCKEDDALRLVLADFLTDETRTLTGAAADTLLARAELIRVQCQLARLATDDPARPSLAEREKQLVTTHGADWAEALGHPVAGYHRGLAFLGQLTPPALQQLPAALFEREPVEIDLDLRSEAFGREELQAALSVVDELAASPRLRCVRAITTLRTRAIKHSDRGYFSRLMRSPHLGNLSAVDLFELIVRPKGIRAMIDSPSHFRLRELHLYGAIEDSDSSLDETEEIDQTIAALVQSEKLSQLRHLSLCFNSIGVDSVAALAGKNVLPRGMRLEIVEANLGPGLPGMAPLLERLSEQFEFAGLE